MYRIQWTSSDQQPEYARKPEIYSAVSPTPKRRPPNVTFHWHRRFSFDGLNAKNIEFKVKLIERTLIQTGGNVAKASRILELSASDVHRLIRQGIVKRPKASDSATIAAKLG